MMMMTGLAPHAWAALDSAAQADSLHRKALVEFAATARDVHRMALRHFEEASRLDPRRADLWLDFGRCCIEAGELQRGRNCFSRAASLLQDDAAAWSLLGSAWKKDWLLSLERSSLDQAGQCFERAAAAAPRDPELWASAAAIALLRGRTRDALHDAQAGRHADPADPAPLLLLGAALDRMGMLAWADSAFRAGRERVNPQVAGWFDRLPGGGDVDADVDPWQGTDPDLTTPENEAQLEYWTRLALALFLFSDGDRILWDRRADLFLRYGPPASIEFDPAWAQMGAAELEYAPTRRLPVAYAPPPLPFPYNMQVWNYPQLGMTVKLWDRSLSQHYEFPYSDEREVDPRPDPDVLAGRTDVITLERGRSVFRTTAPGSTPLAVEAVVHRFPLLAGSRLLVHVFAPGPGSDSLWGALAVSRDGQIIQRDRRHLGASACDPDREQVAEFAVEVPPGTYRLDVSVRGPGSGRGLLHLQSEIPQAGDTLAISDLVLTCGENVRDGEGVQLYPDRDRSVASRGAITFYYEIEHLSVGADGTSRFVYECTVRRRDARHDRASAPIYHATREEQNVGTHRRQFVRVPLTGIDKGSYEVRIEVRDLIAERAVSAAAMFARR